MGLTEEELERNEDGEIIGYEGDWMPVALGVFFGVLIGVLTTGLIVNTGTSSTSVSDISVNGSTAYDVCLSRNYDSEQWTSSHFMHCEDTLELCHESEECLITYKENRSTGEYAHFYAEGDPLFLGWQIRLLEDELPGMVTLGTNYPNASNYEEGTVGWQIWKEGQEKRAKLRGGTR
ncbi:hypothetical protein [Salarchaeum japonicum]|uniref:Uncharacterized protein n=1 Tax=Salarchaeum japonicum TaxID=555573 RepID=A0AAV3SZ93_9EURY|nr:hypothetical protein [Salarchaeum japonicum]